MPDGSSIPRPSRLSRFGGVGGCQLYCGFVPVWRLVVQPPIVLWSCLHGTLNPKPYTHVKLHSF